jgi:hypothetical protein
LVVLVAVSALAAGLTGSAVAIPPDPAGFQTMSPYACPDFGRTQPIFDSTAPIRIKYGWGATTTSQLNTFLRVQSGSVTVTGGPTAVAPDVWGVGDATGWSAFFPQLLVLPGGGTTLNGWATKKYTVFGTLAPGTYTLNIVLTVNSNVPDGPGSTVKKGAWLTITNCPFTVQ